MTNNPTAMQKLTEKTAYERDKLKEINAELLEALKTLLPHFDKAKMKGVEWLYVEKDLKKALAVIAKEKVKE
jgi:hypothetical protein